jgi:hypothetical protein
MGDSVFVGGRADAVSGVEAALAAGADAVAAFATAVGVTLA